VGSSDTTEEERERRRLMPRTVEGVPHLLHQEAGADDRKYGAKT